MRKEGNLMEIQEGEVFIFVASSRLDVNQTARR